MSAPSDLAQVYLDRQQQRADDDTDREFAQLLGGAQLQQPTPTGVLDPNALATQDPATPAPSGFEHDPGIGVRAARDVGLGIAHAPSEALGGTIDAVHQEAKTVKDLGDWISSKLPESLRSGVAYTPGRGLHWANGEELDQLPGAVEAIANLIPTTSSSDTVTGGAVRSIAQFITGQAVLAATPAGALGDLGMAGRAAGAALTGATAFDPQQRLSNLIQEVPALQNPITEWLAAKPDDSDAKGRLKNALESLGLGLATEGLTKALQATKAKIMARGAEQATGDTQGAARQILEQADQSRMALVDRAGDPSAPAIEIRPPEAAPGATPAAAAADQPGEVFVNWGPIQGTDDVKAMVQQLADVRAGNISEAARGVRPWRATKLDAATKDAWQILQDRQVGQPLNAEETFAVRELWVRSAQRMVGLAKAVQANGGEADQIAFRQALSVHNAIQEQVIAARTETARALNSWAIPAGEGSQVVGRIGEIRALAQAQAGTTAELAQGVLQLAGADKARELDAFVQAAAGSTARDRIRQLWYSGLLSNPKTHVRNVVGNLSNLLIDLPETTMGEGAGVAKEKLFGLVQSYRDVWTILKRGTDVLQSEADLGLAPGLQDALAGSKLDPTRGGAWAPEAAGITPDSNWGKVYSVVDAATTWQGKWLDKSDRAFKAMAWNMELRGGAYRQAAEELAQGAIDKAAMPDRIAELMANPSEEAKIAARTFAEVKTFQNQPLNTKLWQAAKAWHNVPLLGDITLPFLKTPYNIATQVMQRTPAAPFMQSWAQDIAEGGAKAEMAWSRFVMGNAVLLTAADLTLSGHLTGQGPADPAAKATLAREGWKPWSVKIGDRYFDYRAFDPIGPALGLAAYAAETIAGRDYGDSSGFERTQQVVSSVALGIGAQLMNQTFMSGMASFVDALSDPQRAGDSWINQFVTSAVVPRGVAQLERVLDPTQRAAYDMVSSVRSQTPFLSESMPARRDLWGRPITVSSGLGWVYDLLSPVGSSKENPEPIDQELSRLGARVPMPDKKLSFQVLTPQGMRSATVDLFSHPEMYQRFLELSGQVVPEQLSGKPLMAALNDLVTGKHPLSGLYKALSDGPEGGKSDQIKDLIHSTQIAARQKLLEEFPALQAEAQWKASQQPGRFDLSQ